MGKHNKHINTVRKSILSRLLRYIQRTDTLLALLAIGLWGMLWSQSYTNLEGLSNKIHSLFGDTIMHIIVSVVYYIGVAIVIAVSFFLAWSIYLVIWGKETESPESKGIRELRKEIRKLRNDTNKQLNDIRKDIFTREKDDANKK